MILYGFAGAAAVLVLVLALGRHFGFAGAAAVLTLVLGRRFVLLVLVPGAGAGSGPALCCSRRFVWPVLVPCWCRGQRIGISFCVMPGMTTCHAQNDIMSCQGWMSGHARSRQGWHHVMAGQTACPAQKNIKRQQYLQYQNADPEAH